MCSVTQRLWDNEDGRRWGHGVEDTTLRTDDFYSYCLRFLIIVTNCGFLLRPRINLQPVLISVWMFACLPTCLSHCLFVNAAICKCWHVSNFFFVRQLARRPALDVRSSHLSPFTLCSDGFAQAETQICYKQSLPLCKILKFDTAAPK